MVSKPHSFKWKKPASVFQLHQHFQEPAEVEFDDNEQRSDQECPEHQYPVLQQHLRYK